MSTGEETEWFLEVASALKGESQRPEEGGRLGLALGRGLSEKPMGPE